MAAASEQQRQRFLTAFSGSFTSALRWHHLDTLWQRLRSGDMDGWYIYQVGEAAPERSASADELDRFITQLDQLLRREHDEEYCGIVYADKLNDPRLIKIYDPNNLGVSCGFSDSPPLPGWILSRLLPCDISAAMVLPERRKRWWARLFG